MPSSQGGLGGIGMELSTKAGIRGVYVEVTKFSFTTHDGVRVGSNTILAFNTFMYQRIGNAFFSSLVSANGNGEAIGGLEDASKYQTLIDNFQTFENGPDDLRNFVDEALPEFVDRLQEARGTLGKKPRGDSLSETTAKSHLACVAAGASTIGFCLAEQLPACLAGLAVTLSSCEPPPPPPPDSGVIVTVTCTAFEQANGDVLVTCTTRIEQSPMIRP